MTEEELRTKEIQLVNREILLNVRERDIAILEGRVKREYAKIHPELEIKTR